MADWDLEDVERCVRDGPDIVVSQQVQSHVTARLENIFLLPILWPVMPLSTINSRNCP